MVFLYMYNMAAFKTYDISDNYSLVLDIVSMLPCDHLCKQVEKIVNELDTDIIENQYSNLGRKALPPKLMLSVIFYGYMTGIRSGRKLSIACAENIGFIYLSKSYFPKKSAINDFRKNHYRHFWDLFLQVLAKCLEAGLADPSLSIVDGSKIESNSSKGRTKTKEQYEKWKTHLLEDIASIEASIKQSTGQELDESVGQQVEQSAGQQTMEELAQSKKLKAQKGLVEKIENAMVILEENPSQTQVNLTDPDAPIMKGKKGYSTTNYNVQAACGEDQVITFCDVVLDGNDKTQLVPILEGVIRSTKKKVKVALADADYGTFDSLEYMAKSGITGYVPYRDMETTFKDKPFHKVHFSYNQKQDYYSCPSGKQLYFYRTSQDKKTEKEYHHYRVDNIETCKRCLFRDQCVSQKVARRVIERESRQHLREEMKERLNSEAGKEMYSKRLHPIEALFGHIKYNLGYTQFLLRGLEKVKAEFILICLTYNLRKLIGKLLYFLINLWTYGTLTVPRKQNSYNLKITNMIYV